MCEDSRIPLKHEKAQILENECIAPNVYLMEVTAPYCARHCTPGQFIHLRLPDNSDELLRLPFSIYGRSRDYGSVQIMYQVVGRGTQHMAHLSMGDSCDLIGPVGQGWSPPSDVKRALLVGGGLGVAPLTMLARDLCDSGVDIDIVIGAPTAIRLVGRSKISAYGNVTVATDDGSCGVKGFCTEVSSDMMQVHSYDYVATCGPQPMQEIVARQAREAGVHCEVSLERLMACGIGACLSCVVDTRHGLKRACVDGPVFDAEEVFFDEC